MSSKPTQQAQKEIRAKFYKEYDGCCIGITQATSEANKKDIADWWLAEILAGQRSMIEQVREKTEKDFTEYDEYDKKSFLSSLQTLEDNLKQDHA